MQGSKPTCLTNIEASPWVEKALEVLFEARSLSVDLSQSNMEFAVEIGALRDAGLNNSHLRWLVGKGYVQHILETTEFGADRREFKESAGLRFWETSCFEINELGVRRLTNGAEGLRMQSTEGEYTPNSLPPVLIPRWDSNRHELLLEGVVVKRFRHRSPNQERVLNVFQEEGWPQVIHDPLIPNGESCPKRRLNDTIKGLNHRQENPLIRFRGDGTGEGVFWECRE